MATQPASAVRALDRAHVLHPWSVQSRVAAPVIVSALGAVLRDEEGNEYLDFMSQLGNVNLGHQDPRIIKAIAESSARHGYVMPTYLTESQANLAATLAELAPGDLNRCFFVVGGSEANEAAIQLARLVTGRQKIISRYRSYHGATYGANTVSGGRLRLQAGPGIPNVVHALENYCYRCPFGHTYPGCGIECARHFEHLIEVEGPEEVAAILVEPIAHNDGVLVPPPEYLPMLRDICDRHGILLIMDEILTGFGRTGKWFATEHWGVVPDLMTVSKGLTSGYASLGAVIVREPVARFFDDHAIPFGFTNGGETLAFDVAAAVIGAYREDDLIERARVLGQELEDGLHELQAAHPSIGEVRGKGLMYGAELVLNRAAKLPAVPTFAGLLSTAEDALTPFRKRLFERRVLLQVRANVVRFYPPLTISRDQMAHALEVFDEALALVDPLVG